MNHPKHIKELLESTDFDYKPFEEFREYLHKYPDLSTKEASSARTILKGLKKIGVSPDCIHEGIGGYGCAAVIASGSEDIFKKRLTLLLRADFDALPLKENTALPFASQKTQEDAYGLIQPVMHACGHDIHAAALLGAAAKLLKLREHWTGQVILLFQPAEEKSTGAKAMVDDGLYEKVPTPDIVLGQHVSPNRAGQVAIRAGQILSASESYEVTFFGRGGHGSMPFVTIDPILMASSAVVRLQSIVAREINTDTEMAVVTVGSFHAGATENVIPDTAVIRVNIRAYSDDVLARVVASVRRVVQAEAQASGALKDPELKQIAAFPATANNAQITQQLSDLFATVFSGDFDPNAPKHTASDDFSNLATAVDKPYAFWGFGGTDPDVWDKAEAEGTLADIPKNHQSSFAPVTQPTLKVGVDALCAAVLSYLGHGDKTTVQQS